MIIMVTSFVNPQDTRNKNRLLRNNTRATTGNDATKLCKKSFQIMIQSTANNALSVGQRNAQ
jgi:hypothetical protein